MKKIFNAILLVLIISVFAEAQSTAYRVYTRTTLPTTCQKSSSSTDIVVLSGTNTIYVCQNSVAIYPDNWLAVGSGSGEASAPDTNDVDTRLSTTTIELNNTTPQDLYTVPVGKTLIITKFVARDPTGATLLLNDGDTTQIRILNSDGAVTISSMSITGVTATGIYLVQMTAQATGSTAITAGNKVQARPNLAFGVSRTVIIDLFGYTF